MDIKILKFSQKSQSSQQQNKIIKNDDMLLDW